LKTKGIVYAVLAAFGFGVMPIITKAIYRQTPVDPFFFLMARYCFAAVLIWIYILFCPNRPWKKVDRQNLGTAGLTGILYIIVTAAYFIALRYIDASLNSLLVFTFPVFTPFLAKVFFKQKIQWSQVASAIIVFGGCSILIGNYHLKGISGELMGIGCGLFAGFLYGIYSLLGQKATLRLEPLMVTALNLTLGAGIFLLLRFSWLWRHPQPISVYLAAGIIAVFSTILANIFYFEAIKAVGAIKAGIYSCIEPFFTAVLAIIFLNERLGGWQWLGALLILGGMVSVQLPWKRDPSLESDSAPRKTPVNQPGESSSKL